MFRGLQLRANGDFRFVTVDFLRGADYFAGDRAQIRPREVFLATAREKQKNERGARRENPHAPAQIQV